MLNEVDGFDHTGTGTKVGTPAIFGMNFQTVSTAQKLLTSEATIGGPVLNGGYLPGTTTPGPLLSSALDYINAQLQKMDQEIQAQGLTDSTAIIITAKHGQSPQNPNQLRRIQDGPIITAINDAWTAAHPGAGNLIVAGTDDDLWQSYLSDRSRQAADFVKHYLWTHDAPAVTYSGSTVMVAHSGLAKIYAGNAVPQFFGVPASDPRHPERVRPRPGGRRLHRRLENRRARRQQPRRPECADPGVRTGRRESRHLGPLGRDHPDRTDDPAAAGARSKRPEGRADRSHAGASGHQALTWTGAAAGRRRRPWSRR
ncbi:MAG TPA: hypothetical protein VG325_16970 [Solirubrobacteraceae bacterium]|nr:hypothetical protein [Solirubrobacteraceae bacterium]